MSAASFKIIDFLWIKKSIAGSLGPFLDHLNSLGISASAPTACPLSALKQYHSHLSQDLSVPDLSKPGKGAPSAKSCSSKINLACNARTTSSLLCASNTCAWLSHAFPDHL